MKKNAFLNEYNKIIRPTPIHNENRTPTPLELGCANPNRPCLIENAVVSDPPLKQVVAKTYEAGLRGNLSLDGGRVEWKLG